jgi:hypothetical protein
MNNNSSKCPLCSTLDSFILHHDVLGRKLFECAECRLVFADGSHRPDAVQEMNRYLQHNNSLDNPDYLNYIESKLGKVIHLADEGSKICDYGSGPANALNHILSSGGYTCHSYDPFFNPNFPVGKVDFIIAIESAEHFFHVHDEFARMNELIDKNGKIAVFTSLWNEKTDFSSWHYARDITHVSFYHQQTFKWIASAFGLELILTDHLGLVVLQKS